MASNPIAAIPSSSGLKDITAIIKSPKESEKQNKKSASRKRKKTINDATVYFRRNYSKILRSTKVMNLPPFIRKQFRKRLMILNESKTIKI